MNWLIQKKFDYDPKVRELYNNLERMKIPYTFCSVIPFSDDGIEYHGEVPKDPVFIYGSYTLAKIAKKYFKTGTFISDNLNLDILTSHYKENMLNYDIIYTTIEDFTPILDKFFIRPIEDTKSFCGTVMTSKEFTSWSKGIVDSYDPKIFTTLPPNTPIAVSSVKNITKEIRFFIVDGKVATYSQYKLGDKVIYSGEDSVERYITDYVYSLIYQGMYHNGWIPEKCFVMDIAVTESGEPKVIETNCINAVGLYAIDTQKLINAIEVMGMEY